MSSEIKAPILAGPERPRFIDDENAEKLWDVVLAMSGELAATRARLAALEQILVERGSLEPNTIETWRPSAEASVARAHDLQAYTQRVFGSLGKK